MEFYTQTMDKWNQIVKMEQCLMHILKVNNTLFSFQGWTNLRNQRRGAKRVRQFRRESRKSLPQVGFLSGWKETISSITNHRSDRHPTNRLTTTTTTTTTVAIKTKFKKEFWGNNNNKTTITISLMMTMNWMKIIWEMVWNVIVFYTYSINYLARPYLHLD